MVTSQRGGAGSVSLTITCVNPLDYAEEIKQLFVAHQRLEFPEFFDRAYEQAVADGAVSWIARDGEGRLCAHAAEFPTRFLFGRRNVRGSLLVNMMVAAAYRTFWPALGLVRRVVEEARKSGSVDFLYADPGESGRAVLQAGGFRLVGTLQRFVLPLTDRRRSVDLGLRLYHLIGRLRARMAPLVLTERSASEIHEGLDLAPPGGIQSLRPIQRESLYRRRLAGYPSPSDCWYTLHSTNPGGAPIGEALVRGPDSCGRAMVCVLECEPVTLWSSVLVTLARRLRQAGAARLEICVVAESRAASEARWAGFLPRPDRLPIVALPLTVLGAEAIAAGSDWQLAQIDLDR